MKKYERPEIKEIELEVLPLCASDVDPQDPTGEGW